MRTHAIFLRLEGRRCVVIGGDHAAAAKVQACLDAGAAVSVVADDLTPGLAELVRSGRIGAVRRAYRAGDLGEAFLAYASVRDPATVTALRAEAERGRILLNVIDAPEDCTFISPAVLARGDLQVAISTGGASPGLSARLRRELETHLGREYGPYVAILGAVRRALEGRPDRGQVMGRLVDSELLGLVRRGDGEAVDRLLAETTGTRCSLGDLGVMVGGEG